MVCLHHPLSSSGAAASCALEAQIVSTGGALPGHTVSGGAVAHKPQGGMMSILGWIVLGLIAGYIASKIVESRGQGFFINILLGIIGGMVGGWLFERFGGTGITGFNLWSMFVAVIGVKAPERKSVTEAAG